MTVQDSARRIELEWTKTINTASGTHSNGPIIAATDDGGGRMGKKVMQAGPVVVKWRPEDAKQFAVVVKW